MEIFDESAVREQSERQNSADTQGRCSEAQRPEEISWLTRKMRLSINRRLIDKNVFGNKGAFTLGFEPHQLDVMELLDEVLQGYAYSAEYKGPRNNQNFRATDLLSVDIDGTMTLDQAVDDPFVAAHGTFIYTTASHTPEKHHFRIGFALARTIEDGAEMRAAVRSLILKFGSDPNASEPARIFYGNRKAEVVWLNGGIPSYQLDQLIQQGRGADQSDMDFARRASSRSSWPLPDDQQLVSAKGVIGTLSDFPRSESLYCPRHKDTHPSAFVIVNRNGQKGIHCKACAQSFWPAQATDKYDFYSFEAAARDVKRIPRPADDIDAFFDWSPGRQELSAANIRFVEERYLDDFPIPAGATFIKSPKGTGKTQMLKRVLQREPGRFLLIGHRRTLIRSTCNKLGLDCYLTEDGQQSAVRQDRYGVCLDSLLKIKTDTPYDYILIDESEQVLAHFLSSTIAEKRIPVLHRFIHLISRAKRVVALDADLSWNSFLRICEWRQKAAVPGENTILINTFRRPRGTIRVVPTKQQLVAEVHKAVGAKKRCFVTANSRAAIERLEASLRKTYSDVALIAITSTTVKKLDDNVRAFLDDPRLESTKYQVVLASPSLGTGVDLSFEREQDHFDVVFGLFEPLVLTHFDCDQQLARVRAPKEVRVFIDPSRFGFETDLEAVTSDALHYEMMGHLIKGYSPEGRVEYHEWRHNDPLFRIAASVLSSQRASKNDLKTNFIEYVGRQGWEVKSVPSNFAAHQAGTVAWAMGKKLARAEAIRRLMDARSMTDEEFEQVSATLKEDDFVDDDTRASFTRSFIERFYQANISPELIDLDDNGHMRSQVMLFEQLIDKKFLELKVKMAFDVFSSESQSPGLIANRGTKGLFTTALLAKTPYYSLGEFNLDAECRTEDLTEFVDYVRKHAITFETQFDRPVRADLAEKPISQLKAVFHEIGLDLIKTRTESIGGQKSYLYGIRRDYFDQMIDIAERRRAADRREIQPRPVSS
ncbi:plasmid replication protein, CyRepA1 family [Mesorhizobium sp.]|uniref:plasmid replication protein, CyRepA1 family n=1 Tax=Mesorhizobium sp. TaxID=1871066 RepID=UPI000FE5F793|nr:plasmid replication protein, CyRepA1 family [Mesorhizobium sp.]RWM10428.1 MAG: hypothetical protein EOR71_06625 [Mesorhizobium sp.]